MSGMTVGDLEPGTTVLTTSNRGGGRVAHVEPGCLMVERNSDGYSRREASLEWDDTPVCRYCARRVEP